MSHGCVPAACALPPPVSSPLMASATPATSTNTRRSPGQRITLPISQHIHSAILRVFHLVRAYIGASSPHPHASILTFRHLITCKAYPRPPTNPTAAHAPSLSGCPELDPSAPSRLRAPRPASWASAPRAPRPASPRPAPRAL